MSDEITNIPQKDSPTGHQGDNIREHFQFETMNNDNRLSQQKRSKPTNQVNNSKASSLAKYDDEETKKATEVLDKIAQTETSATSSSKTKPEAKPTKLFSGAPSNTPTQSTPKSTPSASLPASPKNYFGLGSKLKFLQDKNHSTSTNPSSPSNLFKKLKPNNFNRSTSASHYKTFQATQSKKFSTPQEEILSSQNIKTNNFVKRFNEYRRHILYLSIFLVILCGLWFVWVKKEESILAWVHVHYHRPSVTQVSSLSHSTNFKLLIPAKSKTIDFLGLANLVNLVNSLNQQFQAADIVVLRIKDEHGNDVKMSLLNKALMIKFPLNLSSALTNEYNLFAYLPTSNEKVRCQQALITDKECFGPRIGLILKIKDNQSNQVISELRRMPIKNLINNLSSIFLFSPAGEATSSDVVYRGVKVHYVNLPISTMSLDYAIINNYLVIATSKNSFRRVIDKIIDKK